MAGFDELYRMQQGQNNPLINLQQMQARMPNWLSAPRPVNPLDGTQQLVNTMHRFTDVDQRQQQLDIERQRAKDLSDIQLQTFQAEMARNKQAQAAREGFAGQEGLTPMQQAAIRAGHGQQVATSLMAPGETLSVKDRAGMANTLRDDFNRQTAPFEGVRTSYENIKNASHNAIGDVSRTYSLLKLFDPGAAVQEGDKANIENAGGAPGWIVSLYNQALGTGIDPKKRTMIEAEAGNIYNRALKTYGDTRKRYESLGTPYQIAPSAIAPQTKFLPYEPGKGAGDQPPIGKQVEIKGNGGNRKVTRISD